MAGLTLVVPGVGGDRPAHRKATLASTATAIQFDVINPESDLTDLALEWVTQDRAGRKAITQQGAPKLAKFQLKALFVGSDPQQSIEGSLLRLKSLASNPDTVALAYGQLGSHALMTHSGHWLINDLQIHVQARAQGSNEATQAEATIELLEANIPGWTKPASLATAPPANNLSGTQSPIFGASTPVDQLQTGSRTYTTSVGESLVEVALATYGSAEFWRAIGAANGILDPRQVLAGIRLLIP